MADPGLILGRGVAFPPGLGADARVAFSEGGQNIRDAIQIILLTEIGERIRLPGFGAGLGQFLFAPNTTTTRRQVKDRIIKSLTTWEPRIALESVDVEADLSDQETAVATIAYRLIATDTRERITVSVQLAG